jgi:hypothetical protein
LKQRRSSRWKKKNKVHYPQPRLPSRCFPKVQSVKTQPPQQAANLKKIRRVRRRRVRETLRK